MPKVEGAVREAATRPAALLLAEEDSEEEEEEELVREFVVEGRMSRVVPFVAVTTMDVAKLSDRCCCCCERPEKVTPIWLAVIVFSISFSTRSPAVSPVDDILGLGEEEEKGRVEAGEKEAEVGAVVTPIVITGRDEAEDKGDNIRLRNSVEEKEKEGEAKEEAGEGGAGDANTL